MTEAEILSALAALPGVTAVRHTATGLCIDLERLDPDVVASIVAALDLRLGAVTGTPLGPIGETALVYHFVALDRVVDVATTTHGNAAPSLALLLRPANWAEREIHDLFDVDFPGHPDLAPLMRPEGFATGMMRVPMCGASRALQTNSAPPRGAVAPNPSE